MKRSQAGTTTIGSDQHIRLMEQLAAHPLFEGLPEDQRKTIVSNHDLIAYRAGQTFIEEGGDADALYIVLAGRCAVTAGGRQLSTVGRGGVIGELGMLANAKRSATVTTTRDTVVAVLPRVRLEWVAKDAPLIWRALGECASRRAVGRSMGEEAGRGALAIAIVGVGDVDLEAFTRSLCEAFGVLGPAVEVSPITGSAAMMMVHDEAERSHDFVFYRTDPADPKWTRVCMRQADRIVVVANGWEAPPDEIPLGDAGQAHVHLLLRQPADIEVATDTARWLDAVEPRSHHHVREGNADDLARAARLLAGQGIGLSLAGASSRGVGHFGLLRSLREQGIPVDMVTGSSAGGVVAATVAMNLSEDEGRGLFSAMLECSKPTLGRLTAPLVAMMSGNAPVQTLQTLCRGYQIEDLLIPLLVPATDLLHAERYVFARGPLWRALRATGSLPLFWPPLVWNGRVLVDSGLISNQPIDLLTENCSRGWMIAQDLLPADLSEGPLGGLDESASVSGWRLLWERIWPLGRRTKVAMLPDIIIHSMTIPSYQAQRQWDATRHDARSLMLRPDLPSYSFFAVGPDQQGELIENVHRQTRGPIAQGWSARSPQGTSVEVAR